MLYLNLVDIHHLISTIIFFLRFNNPTTLSVHNLTMSNIK